jgi:hypothetical protein
MNRTLFFLFIFFAFRLGAQTEVPEPRVLNEEFHKVFLHVVSVVPSSDRHAVVSVREVKKLNPNGKFAPQVGEVFMASFIYTTSPTRNQERFKHLTFVLPGVKPGDIISCQLLGDPSPTDASRVNWKVYEYVVVGNEGISQQK